MTKSYRHGQFVWREMMTTDVSASIRFYTEAFGWKTETMRMPDGDDYTMCTIGESPVAGISKLPVPNVPAHWAGSVSVADVDATAKRVVEAGGKVLVPPLDAGGMGRYAGFMDPQGAVCSAWKGTEGDSPSVQRRGPGEFCWEQLNTTAPTEALAFYQKVFGWTNKPFGSGAGDMKVFEAGAEQVASLMPTPPGVPAHWLSYVVVDQLPSAQARVTQQGGKVLLERMEIPTVGAISVVQDNLGATIGLFEMPRA